MLTGRTAGRFAAVGVVNTALDLSLFLGLHHALGVVAANLVSTSAGMTLSFIANGRFTFGGRLTRRSAALFVATTGLTMWVLQPAVIELLLSAWGEGALHVPVTKGLAIGVSVAANYAAYRFLVWPAAPTSDPRPSGRDAAPSGARR